VEELPFRVFAKLEGFNPGNSIKDRAALYILTAALARGDISEGTTVVESSSGNMGIGLAQACSYLGLRFICVIDAKTTAQNVALLPAYGAEIDLITAPDPATGDYLTARLARVAALVATLPGAYWPNQYGNFDNALAHYQTMREIVSALESAPDFLFCPTSSCGTIRGCAE
jgi:cysteine synthase A